MYGLDATLVDEIDYGLSLGRVKTDVLTDFILAPHYSVVYTYAPDELIERVKTLLRNGEYTPELPIKADIPKPSGLTRPGAILVPVDRLVYQMLVDNISQQAEAQLDRSRVFSHVLLSDDPEYKMFKSNDECWQNMRTALSSLCQDRKLLYAISTDVACHFERIYQHNLINLLHASGCDSRFVNLLEKILLAFTEKNSHGILQGMFASDLLGNFSLASLDDYLRVQGIPSVRYVDDIFVFCTSLVEAKKQLASICRILRREGMNLNESKTRMIESEKLLAEETEVDRLFDEAKKEVRGTPVLVQKETFYGFESMWTSGEEVWEEEQIELIAVRELYKKALDNEGDAEKIERFCLPYFSKAHDDIAVEETLGGVLLRPHLSKVYCSYLMPFARGDSAISQRLESIIVNEELPYDWSLMWPMAVLVEVNSVTRETIDHAISVIEDSRRLDSLRAIAAHLVSKHGTAGQRRLLKNRYELEPSSYVKSAIMFSTKYFPTDERNSCLGAWGSHSVTNSLIATAIRRSG